MCALIGVLDLCTSINLWYDSLFTHYDSLFGSAVVSGDKRYIWDSREYDIWLHACIRSQGQGMQMRGEEGGRGREGGGGCCSLGEGGGFITMDRATYTGYMQGRVNNRFVPQSNKTVLCY